MFSLQYRMIFLPPKWQVCRGQRWRTVSMGAIPGLGVGDKGHKQFLVPAVGHVVLSNPNNPAKQL